MLIDNAVRESKVQPMHNKSLFQNQRRYLVQIYNRNIKFYSYGKEYNSEKLESIVSVVYRL